MSLWASARKHATPASPVPTGGPRRAPTGAPCRPRRGASRGRRRAAITHAAEGGVWSARKGRAPVSALLRIELLGGFRVAVGADAIPDWRWARRKPAASL